MDEYRQGEGGKAPPDTDPSPRKLTPPMKALLCTHYGTPDDLEIANIPDPTPDAGEAVVRIEAAALNFFDTLIIAGKYQTKPAFPFSPSAEFAGTVESVASDVTAFKPGDRVLGFTGYGAAREKIALPTAPPGFA